MLAQKVQVLLVFCVLCIVTLKMSDQKLSPAEVFAEPLTLPCGLVLPSRLVKCPMQETLAVAPFYEPPIAEFVDLYGKWGNSKYGFIVTGQVKIDIRCAFFFSASDNLPLTFFHLVLSTPGDTVCHAHSLCSLHVEKCIEWSKIINWRNAVHCLTRTSWTQVSSGSRQSTCGYGASLPLLRTRQLWRCTARKMAIQKLLGTPKAMDLKDVDGAVADWKRDADVAAAESFTGIQLHGAPGFLLSQLCSPLTNRRTDEYRVSPEGRMKLLR